MKTKVIFRVFGKDKKHDQINHIEYGTVIAIFPEEVGNINHHTCMSYMHVGQHGVCSPDGIIYVTRLAKPEEYASLKAELESIGYDLDIRKKYSYYSAALRMKKIEESRKTA